MTKETLVKNLLALRSNSGMTQEKLAEEAKISKRYYIEIEHGKSWPSPETIDSLAKALKVKPSSLLGETTVVEPSPDAISSFISNLIDENRTLKKQIEAPFTDYSSDSRYKRENEKLRERIAELESQPKITDEELNIIALFRAANANDRSVVIDLLKADNSKPSTKSKRR